MQAISPQLLNVFTSNWIQRFLLVGLEIFAYTEKIQTLYCHILLLLCECRLEVLKHCVDGAHSYFTIQQKYNQFCIPDQGDSTCRFYWNFAPTSPEMQLFMAGYTELKQGPCVG